MTAELTDSYAERSEIVGWRMIVSNLLGALYGYLIFTFVFAQSEAFPKGQLDPDNYVMFAPLLGALVTFWCFSLHSLHPRPNPIFLSAHRCPIVWFGLYAINRGCPEQS